MPLGHCEHWVGALRAVWRVFFLFKELAKADGGLDQAGGGMHGSVCGQGIAFNELGQVRLGKRNRRSKLGTIVFHGQRSGWSHQEGGQWQR